jgi:hypothetical protein
MTNEWREDDTVIELREDMPMAMPGVCFICERAPIREAGVRVVDTSRDYAPEWSTLAGRKYVCSECVGALLNALIEGPGI